MATMLYLISLIGLALGVGVILYTENTRALLKTLTRQTDPRLLAAPPLIFGLLLVVAAGASHYPWFVRFLGIAGLAKAAFLFINPQDRAARLTAWFLESLSDNAFRLWGIITVVLATALCSWVR
jgi:uncharacterized protein YjeT (DUF2065 family)